jgi:hypothetical protein
MCLHSAQHVHSHNYCVREKKKKKKKIIFGEKKS